MAKKLLKIVRREDFRKVKVTIIIELQLVTYMVGLSGRLLIDPRRPIDRIHAYL